MPFFDQKRRFSGHNLAKNTIFGQNNDFSRRSIFLAIFQSLVDKQYFTSHIQFYKRSKICNISIVPPRNQMLQILGSDCINISIRITHDVELARKWQVGVNCTWHEIIKLFILNSA